MVGEDEMKKGKAILKHMDSGSQEEIAFDTIVDHMQSLRS